MRLFSESSLHDLYTSAVVAFPNTTKRQYATDPIRIVELTWSPFVGMKTLFIKGRAINEDREYNSIIVFKNVNYGEKDVRIIASNGAPYSFGRLSLENTDVLVRCNCADYAFRFNYYNHLDGSLYGRKRKRYESKGIGPPANPMEMPGMCKHIMKTIKVLKEAEILAT